MSSPGSGTSSGSSSMLPNSGSDEDLQHVMDQRKRKRMLSNRESARRSRMRKQKHLNDLMNQMAELRKENSLFLTTYKITTQQYLAVEADNSVLRTQMVELGTRLQSLNEILAYMNGGSGDGCDEYFCHPPPPSVDAFINPWIPTAVNQPIMASAADMMFY